MRAGIWTLVGVIALLGASGHAGAAPRAVVLPAGPLKADGETVHALRLYLIDGDTLDHTLPSITAARGAIALPPRAAPDGGVDFVYRPPRARAPDHDTLSISAHGARLTAPLALEPPGRVQIALTVTPDPLVLGRGATAEVKVHVVDAAGRPARAALRLGASVGRVSPPVERAPGEYVATFTPPEDKFPQVAIVAALSIADAAFAAAPCRLSARVNVPGEGEPGAAMRIVVDGRSFGPVTVGPDGHFALPILVPPGGRATGITVDTLGNRRERDIDLHLPPFPRLLLTAVPPELPADGRARAQIVAFAVDARGVPERERPPELTADRGSLSPPSIRDGVFAWSYTAPREVGPGVATLRAGAATARIGLRPAPPFQLALESPGEALAAGSDAPAELVLRVRDAGRAPVAGAHLEAQLAGGRVLGIRELGGGRYAVRLSPPRDPSRGSATLHVELRGVEAGAPRHLTLHPVRAPAGRFAAEAWVDDDLGLPVAGALVDFDGPGGHSRGETDRYGTAHVELARPQPCADRRAGCDTERFRVTAQLAAQPGLEAALDVLQVGGVTHAVPSVAGQGVTADEGTPPGATLDAELLLKPAAPVDLQLSVEREHTGRALRVRVTAHGESGQPLTDLLYQASAGKLDVLKPADARGTAELRFTPPEGARAGTRFYVTVTDPKTRVTVFTEVPAP